MRAIDNTLAGLLYWIHYYDRSREYDKRNAMIYQALFAATQCGYQAGIRLDPQEPEWPVIFIELPQGQVSWHVPQHPIEWDKHTTEEKYSRAMSFVDACRADLIPGR